MARRSSSMSCCGTPNADGAAGFGRSRMPSACSQLDSARSEPTGGEPSHEELPLGEKKRPDSDASSPLPEALGGVGPPETVLSSAVMARLDRMEATMQLMLQKMVERDARDAASRAAWLARGHAEDPCGGTSSALAA